MRFLADMGVSKTTLVALRQHGHDVEHLSELGLHQMEDQDIVSRAKAQERVVLTFDLDFGEIMALAGSSRPSVILFRMRNQTPPVENGSCIRFSIIRQRSPTEPSLQSRTSAAGFVGSPFANFDPRSAQWLRAGS